MTDEQWKEIVEYFMTEDAPPGIMERYERYLSAIKLSMLKRRGTGLKKRIGEGIVRMTQRLGFPTQVRSRKISPNHQHSAEARQAA